MSEQAGEYLRMIRRLSIGVLLAGVLGSAQAGVLVVSEQGGKQAQQYFDEGSFVLVEGGKARFGVDRAGNCWFVQQGRLVTDPCDRMLDSMRAMREQVMAGIGPRERAMMQQMLQTPGAAQSPEIKASGSKTIAGYSAECHRIGSAREVCLSAKLMREIQDEMGGGQFIETFQRFTQSAAEFGGRNPQAEALAALYQRGFPMLDMQQAPSVPGINPAMLQYLPEAQRAQLMQQMGGGAGAAQLQGTQVIRVQKGVAMPKVDLAGYPRMGFEEFMGQQAGGMLRGR